MALNAGLPSAAQQVDAGRLYRDRDLQTVFALSLVAVMGVASIAPVFPELATDLGVDTAQIGLLIVSFSLPAVVLSPFLGLLADRIGRRNVLVPSLFLFAIAGTACAFTRDFQNLLLLRSLQGVGAAPLQALSITLIGDLFVGPARAAAVGLNGMVISVGAVAYPIIGGLVATANIYYPFALSALAVPAGLLVLRRIGPSVGDPPMGIRGQVRGVLRCAVHPSAIGLFLAGALTMVLFFGVHVTYLPLLLGAEYSASPVVIGMIMSVTHVMFAMSSSQFRRVQVRVSTLPLIGAAFGVYGAATLLIPVMPNKWMLMIPAALFGLVHGVNIPAQQMGLVGQAPREFRAAFMSLNTTVIRVGQTVGPLLVGLFYVAGGFGTAFLASAVLAFAASAVGLGLHVRAKRVHA